MILVHPKVDLSREPVRDSNSIPVSAVTGEGISALLERVAALTRDLMPAEDALSLNRRQADLLTLAVSALSRAGASGDLPILAEELRLARNAFDRITGRAGVEDVLDSLFSRFCLGK
jgi:tRNA modification GTPase